MSKSKTTRVNECREKIIKDLCAYASLAAEWEPREEQDFDSFIESLNKHLEKAIE